MRKQVLSTAVLAAMATLGFASAAAAAPGADGVFYIHGTGNYCPPSSDPGAGQASGAAACSWSTKSAVDDYWTAGSLGSMASSPAGGQWSYGVAGYAGDTQNSQTSWGTVADQLYDYYYYGNGGAIYNVVAVTHSNGNNPIRYLLAHPTAVTPKGRTASTVISVIKKVVFIAGDGTGTPLADKVMNSWSLAGIGNSLLGLFGTTSGAAVPQQVQANMASYNGNGTFATGTVPGGVTANYVQGTQVYASIWSGDAWCGGYPLTVGLKAAALYGWGSSNAATDGFIGTGSSSYVGTYGWADSRFNHNQSRRSCHGGGGQLANLIHGAMGGTFTAPPADYVEPPSVQACDIETPKNVAGYPSGSFYQWGCTATMHSDTNTDTDCLAVWGSDNGYSIPTDYTSTGYSNTSYYASSSGCSDTWLGDGECDLCLLAKYGYDSANGGTGPDDCVNAGTGSTNKCADIFYNYGTSKNEYHTITVTH